MSANIKGSFEMNLKSAVEGHNGKLYGPVNARRRRKNFEDFYYTKWPRSDLVTKDNTYL